MANVLLTWELGGGLGHCVNLLPLATGLLQRGHHVYVALRDLSRAESIFADLDVTYLQAPIQTAAMRRSIEPVRTFAQMLHNIGFGEAERLCTYTSAWRSIYDLVQPTLTVFDHSPTAMLASRGYSMRRALIGTGFFTPVDAYPLPDLRPWLPSDAAAQQKDEDAVLRNVNQLLTYWQQPPVARLSQLYCDVDENFLVSFSELDHYDDRPAARWWGAWPNVSGTAPQWPSAKGPKIYAYLKPFKALGNFLAALRELQYPTLAYVDGITRTVQRKFESDTLRFQNERLDLAEVGRQCDLAVLNGNHGTTVSMLLAGKPILQIPLTLEQVLFSRRVVELGAGLRADPNKPDQIMARFGDMLKSDQFTGKSQAFADKYKDFSPRQAVHDLVGRACDLADGTG